jgi:hypothetical protein
MCIERPGIIDRGPLLDLVVHGEDGAEVHGADVIGGAVHELADDDPVGALRWVERVPVGVHVPVRAHVGRRRAQPDPVVRTLPTARHLGRDEPCNANYYQRLHGISYSAWLKQKCVAVASHFLFSWEVNLP